MKIIIFCFIGFFFSTLILPVLSESLKGQFVSQSYLANNTFYFDYAKMRDIVVFG